jgi:hypothetical protein
MSLEAARSIIAEMDANLAKQSQIREEINALQAEIDARYEAVRKETEALSAAIDEKYDAIRPLYDAHAALEGGLSAVMEQLTPDELAEISAEINARAGAEGAAAVSDEGANGVSATTA